MRKLKLFFALVLVLTLLTGCGIEMISMPELPEVELSTSTLAGTVEFVNGRTCRILITEGDSHFRAASDDDSADVVQLTFLNITGGKKTVQVGDTVRFEYDYVTQVSEYLGSPHITVNQVRVG